MKAILTFLVRTNDQFTNFLRIAVFIVMAWIGGLKSVPYEAEGIVPFVANSPIMRFFYKHPEQYSAHKNKEGELVPSNIRWHKQNGTYAFGYGLGLMIVLIGTLTLLGIWFPKIGWIGGLLTFAMSLITLSFLITTPETFISDLGRANHGFPYLSGAGRLVIKDIIMSAAGLEIASHSAKKVLMTEME